MYLTMTACRGPHLRSRPERPSCSGVEWRLYCPWGMLIIFMIEAKAQILTRSEYSWLTLATEEATKSVASKSPETVKITLRHGCRWLSEENNQLLVTIS